MNKVEMNYFKSKLLRERKKVEAILKQMEENGVINSNSEMASELSFYDNHPSDIATELFDKEKGIALKKNETNVLKEIDISLQNIQSGTYGKCKECGKEISEERLNFIPYTQYCVHCKKEQLNHMPAEKDNRPSEEAAVGKPFGYGYNDFKDQTKFDAEDTYQIVENFNKMNNVYDYGDYEYEDEDDVGFVEDIEKISNNQYRDQLPD
ncbi:TraR/DksA C4-type zinc finger protein [Clostridium aestuarii]|uniref:TraR/DksA C4-type zinc finger protein n=1 Tax=Clostridium aestuarii TaxID=338193 RepID=A0ABT4CXM5_9CLOT|nr:TraR/DksA C4-type zinc finger protein [Clostridium aestuarii]MCY6483729.1 TraR/DksA C4-type zinc finger protein [Clostridium aestuarii]